MLLTPVAYRTNGERISCLVNASCTVATDNSIYAFGGFHFYTDEVFNDLYVLTTKERNWKKLNNVRGTFPEKRCDHTATLWGDDK